MRHVYCIPAWDPKQVARVGWSAEWASYWFVVYYRGPHGEVEVTDTETTFAMGIDDPWQKITNVGRLLMLTWGEVNWETPDGLYAFRALRDDPIWGSLYDDEALPQSGMDEFVVHALDSRAITLADDAIRGHAIGVSPTPAPLVGDDVRPTIRPIDRVPVHRQRFLRRPNSSS